MQPSTDFDTFLANLSANPDYRILKRLPASLPAYTGDLPAGTAVGLVVDTETTGKGAADAIIELGIVAFVFEEATGAILGVLDTYGGLEDPGAPIPPEATAVNGITDDMVKGMRLDEPRVNTLVEMASLALAHNSNFDRPKVERRFPAFARLPWACSMNEVPWEAAGFRTKKLEFLALEMGAFFEAHRAEADCHALLQLLAKPLSSLEGKTGFQVLLQQSDCATFRVWAEGSPFGAKDLLRDRGYRWSAGDAPASYKAWYIDLATPQEVDAELEWLKTRIYRKSFSVPVTTYDATVRFSERASATQMRYVP